MPGSNPRALNKAKTLDADVLILDLEDAVAPEAKVMARSTVCEAVLSGGYGRRETVVRINGLDTKWGYDDIGAAVAAAPAAILAPKVKTGSDVLDLDKAMRDAGADDSTALWVMIEMPEAILNIQSIGQSANHSRLSALIMGTNDLANELRLTPTADRLAFQTALSLTVAAARANNLLAIDGVYNEIGNNAGLESECAQGRMLGFDGKTLIHPGQLAICNKVFSPDPAEVEQAGEVIRAFADPVNAGKGALKINGKLAESLHLEQAKRLVAMAKAIGSAT